MLIKSNVSATFDFNAGEFRQYVVIEKHLTNCQNPATFINSSNLKDISQFSILS